MKIKAYAKINIGLDVIRKREDGYHEVRMIMQNIDLYDELVVEKTDKDIIITTDSSELPVNEDNLIYKAAKLFLSEHGSDFGVRISLKKNIPVAAGLAGGSTDAAATLLALNSISGTDLSIEELSKIGVRIGADVPYCIMGGTVLSEGIGEILTPIAKCPKIRILLAKPPVGVSTAFVYNNLRLDTVSHPDIDAIIDAIGRSDVKAMCSGLGNVLESVTIPANPVISDIKNIMTDNGALGALMSGSGPSVFGVFESDEDIQKAYDVLSSSGLVKDLFMTWTVDPDR